MKKKIFQIEGGYNKVNQAIKEGLSALTINQVETWFDNEGCFTSTQIWAEKLEMIIKQLNADFDDCDFAIGGLGEDILLEIAPK